MVEARDSMKIESRSCRRQPGSQQDDEQDEEYDQIAALVDSRVCKIKERCQYDAGGFADCL